MDNFDLKKYLAEGKLYENTINQISSRIVKLGKEDSIASEDIEEYIDDLKSSFEPDAYKNITDEELLKDLRVASVFRNKKGSFRNQYSVGNASDIYDDFEVYYERWEDEFARGIDGRERFDFDDEDVWNETNTPGDRVTSHSWEIGYEEEDDYYEPIIYNMLNYLKKNKMYKYKNDDGIDAEFTLDDRGNSVDMVIYYTADDVKNSNR